VSGTDCLSLKQFILASEFSVLDLYKMWLLCSHLKVWCCSYCMDCVMLQLLYELLFCFLF
jgi:hypothetical protein